MEALAHPDLPVAENGIVVKSRSELASVAREIFDTGLGKKFKNAVELMICLQAGMELGFTHVQSIQCIGVVNGVASVHSDGLPALMQMSKNCEWERTWWELDGKEIAEPCHMTLNAFPDNLAACWQAKRKDQTEPSRVYKYFVADAKLAGLWGQNTWAKHPKRMLQRRAAGWGYRDVFADAMKGLWLMDEAQDLAIGQKTPSPLNERFKAAQLTHEPQDDPDIIEGEIVEPEQPKADLLKPEKIDLRKRMSAMLVTKKSQWLSNGASAGEFIQKLAQQLFNKSTLDSLDEINAINKLIDARRINWDEGDIFPE